MEELTERDLELLEYKIQGTLSESDKVELEAKMQKSTFVKAAANFEMLLGGIDAKGDAELKTILLAEEAKFVVKEKKQGAPKTAKVFSMRRIMAVAATLLLLVIATFIWQQDRGGRSNHFADNFSPYKNVLYPIDRSVGEVTTKEQAFKAYEQKDYSQALVAFDAILEDSLDNNLLFFKANALLATDKTEEAIDVFEKIPQHERFFEQSQWYLALAYLQKGDIDSAKKYLETVAQSGGFKSEKAKKLLEGLD